jgi:hypothetical protein
MQTVESGAASEAPRLPTSKVAAVAESAGAGVPETPGAPPGPLAASPGHSAADAADLGKRVLGTYRTELEDSRTGRRVVTLDIRPDGSCVLRTERVGKGMDIASGTWAAASGMIMVVLGRPDDPERRQDFSFVPVPEGVQCTRWNVATFGAEGPGVLARTGTPPPRPR